MQSNANQCNIIACCLLMIALFDHFRRWFSSGCKALILLSLSLSLSLFLSLSVRWLPANIERSHWKEQILPFTSHTILAPILALVLVASDFSCVCDIFAQQQIVAHCSNRAKARVTEFECLIYSRYWRTKLVNFRLLTGFGLGFSERLRRATYRATSSTCSTNSTRTTFHVSRGRPSLIIAGLPFTWIALNLSIVRCTPDTFVHTHRSHFRWMFIAINCPDRYSLWCKIKRWNFPVHLLIWFGSKGFAIFFFASVSKWISWDSHYFHWWPRIRSSFSFSFTILIASQSNQTLSPPPFLLFNSNSIALTLFFILLCFLFGSCFDCSALNLVPFYHPFSIRFGRDLLLQFVRHKHTNISPLHKLSSLSRSLSLLRLIFFNMETHQQCTCSRMKVVSAEQLLFDELDANSWFEPTVIDWSLRTRNQTVQTLLGDLKDQKELLIFLPLPPPPLPPSHHLLPIIVDTRSQVHAISSRFDWPWP
jgi:hypothetical protein